MSLSVAPLFFRFARTLILARILSSFEFGFASALTASYSTFELVTDVAIHRFVFASPRSEYQEALAGAHGLSIIRGGAAGILAFIAAPGLAHMMSLSAEWTSFAWLGLAIFIRSFQHLEIRVAERDYQYNAQLDSELGHQWNCICGDDCDLVVRSGSHDLYSGAICGKYHVRSRQAICSLKALIVLIFGHSISAKLRISHILLSSAVLASPQLVKAIGYWWAPFSTCRL